MSTKGTVYKFIGDAVMGDVERRRRIPITLGLHVGNIVVGNIGSADRMNYTVLGATVKSGGTA
jgi:hypothetical protein